VIAELRAATAAVCHWLAVYHTDRSGDPIDLTESRRRQLVREADYQQWLDEQSRVLRVTGRPRRGRYPLRRLHGR